MPTSSQILSLIGLEAVIFDLDGVLTDTAGAHFEAWKEAFDAFLERRTDGAFAPFELDDYQRYVDGKPRYEGVASFLASRGVELEWGEPDDEPGFDTICALGNQKNERYRKFLAEGRAEVFDDALRFLEWVDEQGLSAAVVSSSKNCRTVVEQAGLGHRFGARVDGSDLAASGMAGKPAPDMFVAAAKRLGVAPQRAIVVEDAVAGVEAGRRGRFAHVIGMAREGKPDELRKAGADIVISSFDELDTFSGGATMKKNPRDAMEAIDEIHEEFSERTPAVFLDYDGTLSPIVDDPAEAVLSDSMRATIERLSTVCNVAVVSGRDLSDVRERVDVPGIAYAGSHGFDILGPEGDDMTLDKGEAFLPSLDRAEEELRERLDRLEGAEVERKRYSLAVHYRNVATRHVPTVEKHVHQVLDGIGDLRMTHGKKVLDLQPDIEWHKGKAVDWLLDELGLAGPDVVPMYIGDDVTDEDAFKTLSGRGVTIVVEPEGRHTEAEYVLGGVDDVEQFLNRLADELQRD